MSCDAARLVIELAGDQVIERFAQSATTLGTRLAVHAGLSVQAGVGQHETFNRFAAEDVRVDDFVNIGLGDMSVPNGIGVDDEVGAVLALIETSGLVSAHFAFEATLRQFLFE